MYYRYFPFPKKHTIFLEKAYYLFRKSTHPFRKKVVCFKTMKKHVILGYEKLVKKVAPDDNPIIMIVKLKE